MRIPVGFVATIPHSGRRSEWARAPAQRAHRTVVLPEWQGLGIGARLSDAVNKLRSVAAGRLVAAGSLLRPKAAGTTSASSGDEADREWESPVKPQATSRRATIQERGFRHYRKLGGCRAV